MVVPAGGSPAYVASIQTEIRMKAKTQNTAPEKKDNTALFFNIFVGLLVLGFALAVVAMFVV